MEYDTKLLGNQFPKFPTLYVSAKRPEPIPRDAASYPRETESLATPPWKLQASQKKANFLAIKARYHDTSGTVSDDNYTVAEAISWSMNGYRGMRKVPFDFLCISVKTFWLWTHRFTLTS
jgi:hypothetical protein